MDKNLSSVFGEGGALSKALASYTPRPQQAQAAQVAGDAMRAEPRIALIEAGTGVGKTMAYLVPALAHARSDRKVIISTHTLALQSQLWERDIPLAQSIAKRPVKAALMKGRGNYLCLQELAAARSELWTAGDPLFGHIVEWAGESESGDLAELPFVYPGWSDIRAHVDTCKGPECRAYEDCFYYRSRRLADDAAIILVNHALYFADLAVRQVEPDARLLPEHDFVVFDEAHHLENAAAGAFGITFSSSRLPALIARFRRSARLMDLDDGRLRTLERESETLFAPFFAAGRPDFFVEELLGPNFKPACEQVALIALLLDGLLVQIKQADTSHNPILADRLEGLARQCLRAKEELSVLFTGTDENYLRWGAVSAMRPNLPFATLSYTPISVAPILRQSLWSEPLSAGAALFSATLATGEGFGYIRQRLGLDEPAKAAELVVDSPFDYSANCLVYVASHLPAPTHADLYARLAIDEMAELVQAAQGGAFLLFTSYRMLQAAYEALQEADLPYPLLRQGDMPPGRLIEAFRAAGNGVLFGTQSFWEGVDVPGSALRLVAIDRLPFAVPDSPLHRARVEAVTREGHDWFAEYALPGAQLRLKQGFGRLIRTVTDRGVVAILDSRLATKSYGGQFLRHLPPAQRTYDMDAVREFYAGAASRPSGAARA